MTNVLARGNRAILQRKKLALFCSVKCPGDLIDKTYNLVQKIRDNGICAISGFHSPVERECLAVAATKPLSAYHLPGTHLGIVSRPP